MANLSPVEGRCNIARGDGTYCGNKPAIPDGLPGANGRCRFHGGFSKLRQMSGLGSLDTSPEAQRAKGTKSGIYSRVLRRALRPSAQLVFDSPEARALTIETEIALLRAKIADWEERRAAGETFTESNSATCKSWDDLIARGIALLDRALKTQLILNPNGAMQGTLEVNIIVHGSTAPKMDLPELEADAAVEGEVVRAVESVPEVDDDPDSPLAELDVDG